MNESERMFEAAVLHPLPKLKPNRYDVWLIKDGYQKEVIFSGTKEECRDKVKQINRVFGVWYNKWINNKDCKFLRDGLTVQVEYSRNQEPKLDTRKPPRGGSGVK